MEGGKSKLCQAQHQVPRVTEDTEEMYCRCAWLRSSPVGDVTHSKRPHPPRRYRELEGSRFYSI